VKILHAQLYPIDPERIPGGPYSAGYHMTHEIAARPGVEVSVVTLSKEIEHDLHRVDGSVPVTFLAQKRLRVVPNLYRDIPRIAAEIERRKPDIVNAQLAIFGVAAQRTGIPMVYLIHGVIGQEARAKRGLRDRLAYSLYAKLDRAAASQASHIIATSQYVVEQYRHITKADFHVIDNAIDDRFFEVQVQEVPGRILFIGLIYERKNLLGALEVIRRLRSKYPDIVLRVAGWVADRKYHERCLRFVSESGLEGNVHFLGMTTREQLLQELSACSLMLMTSMQETAPLVISEAMAAGRPVVTSDVGGCRYLVEDGQTGFVVPWNDTEAFVDRISTLLDDPMLRAQFGRAAHDAAESRFRRSVVADRTLAVYRAVLGIA